MRILLSGGSGFIGSALIPLLKKQGHDLVLLTRAPMHKAPDVLYWNPDHPPPSTQFTGFDAVIHLAGEKIAGLWTKRKMRKILFSRTVGTRALAELLSKARHPPNIFLSPSAVGYFGDCGEEELNDDHSPGNGFLSEVCVQWEAAAAPLRECGCRIVHPRFGVILGPKGGMVSKWKILTQFGLGGSLGSGMQWVSWISLRDALAVIAFALEQPSLVGSFNAVAPEVVRQKEFAKQIRLHLHRTFALSQPAWLLRLCLGRMADELLLASAKVRATKLNQLGFSFLDPTLDKALDYALG